MPRNNLVHVPLADWPLLDVDVLPESDRKWAGDRIKAIELYASGASMKEIEQQTTIKRQEVRRLVCRCQTIAADGRVFGFRALRRGSRINQYVRRSVLTGIIGDGGRRNAGALRDLFERFPGAEQFIRDSFLRIGPTQKDHDARIRLSDLHDEWITWLREKGLKENEWPLTTINEGLETLRRYCKRLQFSDGDRWIAARAGKEAARRSQIGNGIHSIFPLLRPFGAVQLDFHKIDQACIITIVNPEGVEVDVPVARWYIGMMLEERHQLVVGAVLVLEPTPSAEAALETIESAIIPIDPCAAAAGLGFGLGRAVLPNQLLDELKGQCFSVLKMDNAWSNTAFSVIDNVISVVGCAVDFGPVRQWWTRLELEAFFGRLTRSTAQRSPATYGANVADTRRDDPTGKAVHFQIRLSEVLTNLEDEIQVRNDTRLSTNFMASPMAALKASIQNPNSTFLPAKLPRSSSESATLLRILSRKVIRGNAKKGERPYIKINGVRYTNERIAQDFSLVGRAVKVAESIRLANDIFATDAVTGEVLGALVPPRRLVRCAVSLRMQQILNRVGPGLRRRETREMRNKQKHDRAAGRERAKRTPPQSSMPEIPNAKEALAIAKEEVKLSRTTPPTAESIGPDIEDVAAGPRTSAPGAIFNLGIPVQLEKQLRRIK